MTPSLPPVTEPILATLDDARGIKRLTRVDDSGCHHLTCDLCDLEIKLTPTGNLNNMIQHRNRAKQCIPRQKRARKKAGLPPLTDQPAADTERGRQPGTSATTPAAAPTPDQSARFHPYTHPRHHSCSSSIQSLHSRASSVESLLVH